ncbi:MAG: sigma-70 family RNA polymerase sigma factor [Anaerolineae bacterium]|nr:sigma-70 family RNA polymerase sigma factor [Anaerolineae bacterium]
MSLDWQKAPDQTLINGCLQGEEQAWAALIERYSRLIYSIPIRFGFPQTIADEIFQETCLILLEGLHTLQNHDRLSSWLMTVSRRSCIRRIRQKPAVEMEDEWETAVPANDPPLETNLIQLEQEHRIYQALATMPPPCQALLTALFLTEPAPSYEEIATQFDIPIGSIGPYRARCLKKLRLALVQLEQ